MDLTVHIPDEAVPALKAKASGLPLETFAEQVLLEQTHSATADGPRPEPRRFENLSDLLLNSPFAGANLDLCFHKRVRVRRDSLISFRRAGSIFCK